MNTEMTEQDSTKLEFTVDMRFSEFLRFQASWFVRRFKWFLVVIVLLAIGFPIHLAYLRARYDSNVQIMSPGLLIPWVMLALFGGSLYFGTRKQFALWWQGQPMRVSLSSEGISTEKPFMASKYAWSKITSVSQTREFLLLALSDQAVLIFPKRCIGDQSQIEKVMSFAKNAIHE